MTKPRNFPWFGLRLFHIKAVFSKLKPIMLPRKNIWLPHWMKASFELGRSRLYFLMRTVEHCKQHFFVCAISKKLVDIPGANSHVRKTFCRVMQTVITAGFPALKYLCFRSRIWISHRNITTPTKWLGEPDAYLNVRDGRRQARPI